MNNHQQREELELNTKTSFKYGKLCIKMYYKRENDVVYDQPLASVVELYWKDKLLERHESLPEAIKRAFNAVRVCRPDLTSIVDKDRTEILIALESLGRLSGLLTSIFWDTPVMVHLMYASIEAQKHFPHWDDIPSIFVHCGLSNIDRHSFNSEAIFYRIEMKTYGSTMSFTSNHPVWQLPDVQTMVDKLLIKHFA